MLVVDLNRLSRDGRARIDGDIGPDHGFWKSLDVRPHAPLRVRLEAQQVGPDVVVRGRLTGQFDLECRRCLEPVVAGIDEEVGWLFREGEVEPDEPEDVYALPERSAELELSAPVREQVAVAVPRFLSCREDCKGLCPTCGINRNHETCACTSAESDERWAPLWRLGRDA